MRERERELTTGEDCWAGSDLRGNPGISQNTSLQHLQREEIYTHFVFYLILSTPPPSSKGRYLMLILSMRTLKLTEVK